MEKRNEKNAETFMDCFTGVGDSAAEVAKSLVSIQNMISQLLSITIKSGQVNQLVIDKDFDFGLYTLNHITGVILDHQNILDDRDNQRLKGTTQQKVLS